jgi:TonB family protein
MLSLLLAATLASANTRLPDAELIRGFVNLGRVNQLAFALQYRQIQYGNLDIGTSRHERAVALQLLDDELVDPWGTPYRIEIDGKASRVTGAGADRKFETRDGNSHDRVKTFSIDADVVWGGGHMLQENYTWLFQQVGVPLGEHPNIYMPPVFVPLHRRQPNQLPASPDAARIYELKMEQPLVFPRFGDLNAVRMTATRASMELFAARLEAWRAAHGSFAGLAGPDTLRMLRSEAWPFNDWLLGIDQWGKQFRLTIAEDGKSYTLSSLGADGAVDTASVKASSPDFDQTIRDGKFERSFDAGTYEAELRQREDEKDRQVATAPLPAPDGSMAWRIGGDVTAPVAIQKVDPKYPAEALKQRVGGICIVQLVIDEKGNVAHAVAVYGPSREIEKASVDAARQWKFKPATRKGVPVRVFFNLTLSFTPKS